MKHFELIVNGWKPLSIITKSSILDVAAVLDPPMDMLNFSEIYKLHGKITPEFLRLSMRNFQGIVFIWTPTYTEIFKSALVYL